MSRILPVDVGAEKDDQLRRQRRRELHHGLHDRGDRGGGTHRAEQRGHSEADDPGHELAGEQRVGVVA